MRRTNHHRTFGRPTPSSIVRDAELLMNTPSKIGPYEIFEKLGAGGFGQVFRARHELLGREVALKVLHGSLDHARFVREAQILAQLNHPNIVGVHDCGTADAGGATPSHLDDAVHYIALELLEGENLLDLIRRGPVAPDEASWILGEVLQGLAHAHAAGVVHRDLKPSNVLLVPNAQAGPFDLDVKLLDFGVSLASNHDRLTRKQALVGTPRYVAPELLHGQESDVRSDLWAIGVTLVECLVGRPAYGGTADQVIPQILAGPPVLPQATVIGPPLRRVLERFFAPREQRFESATEAADALAAAALGKRISVDKLGKTTFQGKRIELPGSEDPFDASVKDLSATVVDLQIARPVPATRQQTPEGLRRSAFPSGSAAPGSAAPGSAAPGSAAPGSAAPGTVAPDSVPAGVVARSAAPGSAPAPGSPSTRQTKHWLIALAVVACLAVAGGAWLVFTYANSYAQQNAAVDIVALDGPTESSVHHGAFTSCVGDYTTTIHTEAATLLRLVEGTAQVCECGRPAGVADMYVLFLGGQHATSALLSEGGPRRACAEGLLTPERIVQLGASLPPGGRVACTVRRTICPP